MKHTLQPYTEYLLPEMVTVLMNEFSILFANRLEISLMKVKYSQQGVLEMDRIIRGVCNELIAEGGSEIRTNFGKISTIVAILSCDDVRSSHFYSLQLILYFLKFFFMLIVNPNSCLGLKRIFPYCRREG